MSTLEVHFIFDNTVHTILYLIVFSSALGFLFPFFNELEWKYHKSHC